jgi:hypothetical protein
VAHDGGEQEAAGQYRIGYALEEAERMHEWTDGELEWSDPGDENVKVEVSVRDASDGRFVPGVRVFATLIDPDGNEVGTHERPLIWHPIIYHYWATGSCPHTASTRCASVSNLQRSCVTTKSTVGGSPNPSRSPSRA